MRASLLNYLVCPLCHEPFDLSGAEKSGDEIEQGSLRCRGGGHTFSIVNGIPRLLSPEMSGMADKLNEVEGWSKLAQEDNWRADQDRIDLALPYVVRDLGWDPEQAAEWVATQLSFDYLLAHYVRPGLRVLEVGAAKTWAGHYFVQSGCEYTGCDLLDDPQIGVGRSRFYRAHFGDYDAVSADVEHLPFTDGYFDLAVAIAALHHALDLDKAMGELARVTLRGGTIVGLNEGTRAFWNRPTAPQQARAISLGINEHVHSIWEYRRAFERHGLTVTEITRSIGYERLIAPRLRLLLSPLFHLPRLGPSLVTWLLVGAIHPNDGVSLFSFKR